MPKQRTTYHNGDPITLNGCDGCNPSMINGVLCHETGCSEAWRDRQVECYQCGDKFYPETRGHRLCPDCEHNESHDDFEYQPYYAGRDADYVD